MKTIRIAFIGAGPTTREHLKAFADLDHVVLCGIYNRTHEKALALAQEYSIEKCCASLEALYADCLPDAVVVCVYELAKRQVLSLCIPYGIPILAEKPLALNYKESLELTQLAETHHCKVWLGLNRRNYFSTRSALNLLETKSHKSTPRIIEVTDQQDLEVIQELGHHETVLENWMYANSIHLIDYFNIFSRGEPKEVKIMNHWNPENPGFVVAHLTYSSGDIGLYKAYWNGPGPWACTIATPSVFIELKPLEKIKYQLRGHRIWEALEPPLTDMAFKPGFREQATQLINALSHKPHSLADLKSSLETNQLISKIYQR